MFKEGQNCFFGRAAPYLWKGMVGLNSDFVIEKMFIPGMCMNNFVRFSSIYIYNLEYEPMCLRKAGYMKNSLWKLNLK